MVDSNDRTSATDSWRKFLDPDELRPALIFAAIFISIYELFEDLVVARIRGFISGPHDLEVSGGRDEYTRSVLSLDPKGKADPLRASLVWFKNLGALSDQDIDAFWRIKECRNEIVHELPKVVTSGCKNNSFAIFTEMIQLMKKVEVWWALNVEIPTNPDFDGQEVDSEGILPGPVIGAIIMLEVALGKDGESRKYYEAVFGKEIGAYFPRQPAPHTSPR